MNFVVAQGKSRETDVQVEWVGKGDERAQRKDMKKRGK